MANWRTTEINHEIRKSLGISINDWCVLDYIYKTQVHPDYGGKCDGWCKTSIGVIGDFFGLSKGGVKNIIDSLEKIGLLVFDAERRGKKTTEKWYRLVYESKENTICSLSERGKIVHFLNEIRSLSEQESVHFLNINNNSKVIKKLEDNVFSLNAENLPLEITKSEFKDWERTCLLILKKRKVDAKRKPAKAITIEQRAEDFRARIRENKGEYPNTMLFAFFDYWTEKNDKGQKMRFELEKVFDVKKRLATWAKRGLERQFTKTPKQPEQEVYRYPKQINEQAAPQINQMLQIAAQKMTAQ